MPAAASSSIYWNSVDSQRSSGDGSEPTSSSSSSGGVGGGGGRRYIDPWDLENYAYLRRRRELKSVTPRNVKVDEDINFLSQNKTGGIDSPESNSYNNYRYPPPITRESGYDPVTSIEELYLGSSSAAASRNNYNQAEHFFVQDPTYEDEYSRYVTPNPVYSPLSDIVEYSEEEAIDHSGFKLMPRRRNRSIQNMEFYKDECPCPYHGPLSENGAVKDAVLAQPKQLGLNTYGHLRIDYAKSWNSLHRKMRK